MRRQLSSKRERLERNKEGHRAVYLKTRKGARVAVKQTLPVPRNSSKGMMNHTASKQQAKAYSLDLCQVVFVLFLLSFYICG